MWQDLLDQQDKWIGGRLYDYGDSMDRAIECEVPLETKIVGFELTEKWFGVKGEDFDCGGSRDIIGITGSPAFPCDGGLAIVGYGSHEFHIFPVEVRKSKCRYSTR